MTDDRDSGVWRIRDGADVAREWQGAVDAGPKAGESDDDYMERIAAMHSAWMDTMRNLFPHVDMTFDEDPTPESLSTERIPVEIAGLDVDMGFRLTLGRPPTGAEAAAIRRAVMEWYRAGSEGQEWGVIKDVDGPYPVDDRTVEWVADLSSAGQGAFPDLVQRLDAAIKPFEVRVVRLLLTTEPAE
jgi:hypothetical protein